MVSKKSFNIGYSAVITKVKGSSVWCRVDAQNCQERDSIAKTGFKLCSFGVLHQIVRKDTEMGRKEVLRKGRPISHDLQAVNKDELTRLEFSLCCRLPLF